MAKNIKEFWPQLKYVLIIMLFALVVSGIGTFLIEHRVFSQGSKFTANYNEFKSSRAMFSFWFTSFVFISLAGIIGFLFYREKIYWICPSCENVQETRKKQDSVLCNKCGAKMVPLKGFYEKNKTKEN
ncbi:MAG TPA: hypothetical protein PK443_03495 [bacterium]|nr:hypothetical protein [bacterium]